VISRAACRGTCCSRRQQDVFGTTYGVKRPNGRGESAGGSVSWPQHVWRVPRDWCIAVIQRVWVFPPTNYPHELLRVIKGVCRIVLAVPIEVHLVCSASWNARDCWILCRRKASLRFMDQSGASPETSTLMNVGHVLCMARLPLT
jgi:hypothetical protein